MPTPRTTRPAAKAVVKPASDAPVTTLAGLLKPVAAKAAPVRKSSSGPILTLDSLRKSLDEGTPLAFEGLPSEEVVTQVKGDLQRAAHALGCGLSKSHEDNGDGTFTLTFQANADKRKRNYTSVDVRQWAYDVKGIDIRDEKGAIPEDIRKAFRVAKGYDKPTVSADDKSYAKGE